jgi:chromosome segregation ATPase
MMNEIKDYWPTILVIGGGIWAGVKWSFDLKFRQSEENRKEVAASMELIKVWRDEASSWMGKSKNWEAEAEETKDQLISVEKRFRRDLEELEKRLKEVDESNTTCRRVIVQQQESHKKFLGLFHTLIMEYRNVVDTIKSEYKIPTEEIDSIFLRADLLECLECMENDAKQCDIECPILFTRKPK